MKKIKRCIAIILSMVLGFSMSTVSFASERYNQNDNSKGTCSKEDVDLSNGGYTIIYEDGELYIVPSQETLSPTTEPTGPPKAASSKVPKLLVAPSPTFIALRAASAWLLVIEYEKVLFFTVQYPIPPPIRFSWEGESTYVSHLKSFLNSGKSVAYFKFDTHCVNRGTMYGDPMYDYVVDNVRMTY